MLLPTVNHGRFFFRVYTPDRVQTRFPKLFSLVPSFGRSGLDRLSLKSAAGGGRWQLLSVLFNGGDGDGGDAVVSMEIAGNDRGFSYRKYMCARVRAVSCVNRDVGYRAIVTYERTRRTNCTRLCTVTSSGGCVVAECFGKSSALRRQNVLLRSGDGGRVPAAHRDGTRRVRFVGKLARVGRAIIVPFEKSSSFFRSSVDDNYDVRNERFSRFVRVFFFFF